MPFNAFIVEAVRTAGGRKNGRLSDWHPADLGGVVIDEIVKRTGIPPGSIDDVIFGCVDQVGAQAGNIGRNAVLSSCLPESVPGTSVDRQCGSSQQAIHFAAQAVMSGTQDVVIAGGVEVMSKVPIGASIIDGMKGGHGFPSGQKIIERYSSVKGRFSQFLGAEITAERFNVSKDSVDQFSYDSQLRAIKATKEGRFKKEIVPVEGKDPKTGEKVIHQIDEGIRFTGLSLEKIKNLKPNSKGGIMSPASSSQICDGAAAILICNENGLRKLGLTPRARFVTLALAGTDPVMMLAGPIPATREALRKAGLLIDQIDLFEVNEAFASVPLAWAQEVGADLSKLNVNGGAIALGHPLGATGAKLTATLLHELERRKGRYGLQAICEGGGTANAFIIERCVEGRVDGYRSKM
eukprot:76366_1